MKYLKISSTRTVLSWLMIVHLLMIGEAFASPRPPLPLAPETARLLYHQDFDSSFYASRERSNSVMTSYGTLVAGWSGYALLRSGPVTPYLIPALDPAGCTNMITSGAGCVRCWISPLWSSTSVSSGSGPGTNAHLADLFVTDGQSSETIWSLQIGPDATSLLLMGAGDNGPIELLRADISWTAGSAHCVALNYGTNTALFIDGQIVAQGGPTLSVPVSASALVLGSSPDGSMAAEAAIDEIFVFARGLSASEMAFYYGVYAEASALGPIDDDAVAAARATWQSDLSLVAYGYGGAGGPLWPMSGCCCVTGGPPYFTNFSASLTTNQGMRIAFGIAGGSGYVAYDIYRTADIASPQTWIWVSQGFTCNNFTYTNQPLTPAFYMIRPPSQTMIVAWGDDSAGQCDVPPGLTNATAVAAGDGFSLALRSDGTVIAWGSNTYGETNVPSSATNVVSISANWYDALALRGDGTVVEWGGSTYLPPASATNLAMVSMGYGYGMGLRQDGTVLSWGNPSFRTNLLGGLSNIVGIATATNHKLALSSNGVVTAWGDDFFGETNVPSGLTNALAISANNLHSLAVRNDFTVRAWGWDDSGQTDVPTGLTNVVAVAAGGEHSLALHAEGTVVAWGDADVPDFLTGVKAISAGYGHSLALRSGSLSPVILEEPASTTFSPGTNLTLTVSAVGLPGMAYQWQFSGTNLAGQTNASLALTNLTPFQEGYYRVIIFSSAGAVTSSVATLRVVPPGDMSFQTLGPGTTNWIVTNAALQIPAAILTNLPGPLQFQWKKNGVAITGAVFTNYYVWFWPTQAAVWEGDYTVNVTTASGTTNFGPWRIRFLLPGAVEAWGSDDDGQCDRPASLTNVISIAGGTAHSVALREDGTVICWGDNSLGQSTPPGSLSNVVAVAAGDEHSLALRADGTVVSWGNTNNPADSVPTNNAGIKAIAAGWNHNVALLTNGAVIAWGYDGATLGWHLTEVPTGLTNVTAIAAGALHSLALRGDGTVVAWGYSPSGETNVPSGLSNVVAVAAGEQHSLALKADGIVTAWGFNGSGQCTIPTGLSNVMAVAAGGGHSVSLKNDGMVIAWGDNSSGQTNVPAGLTNAAIKMIAAGGDHTLVGVFSPLVQYPVNVANDLLLIYNTNSINSIVVKDYYLAHRPMVGGANVLGIGGPPTSQCAGFLCPATNEVVDYATFTNQILSPFSQWLAASPTKRPQYMILFPDFPTGVWMTNSGGSPFSSVAYGISASVQGIQPFVNSINMGFFDLTNDCIAYINKLQQFGSNYSPGQLIVSASAVGYANTNYVLDDIRHGAGYPPGEDFSSFGGIALSATNGLLPAGVPQSAILYFDGLETKTNGVEHNLTHPTGFSNLAGYICWGGHSSLANEYPRNGEVIWGRNSSWWIIETVESFNGQRATGQGNFTQWFSQIAFGGTNYENTPVGAVSHTDEPYPGGVNDSGNNFGLWASGKTFGISAWNSRRTANFQAAGDPFVRK